MNKLNWLAMVWVCGIALFLTLYAIYIGFKAINTTDISTVDGIFKLVVLVLMQGLVVGFASTLAYVFTILGRYYWRGKEWC